MMSLIQWIMRLFVRISGSMPEKPILAKVAKNELFKYLWVIFVSFMTIFWLFWLLYAWHQCASSNAKRETRKIGKESATKNTSAPESLQKLTPLGQNEERVFWVFKKWPKSSEISRLLHFLMHSVTFSRVLSLITLGLKRRVNQKVKKNS